MDDLLIGRKEIMKAFGVSRWQTVRNWCRKYGFSLVRMPNGKPAILNDQVRQFILRYDKQIRTL